MKKTGLSIRCDACGSEVNAMQMAIPGKLPNGSACDHRNKSVTALRVPIEDRVMFIQGAMRVPKL